MLVANRSEVKIAGLAFGFALWGWVGLLGGCAGYLEEQAWFPDGGRVVVGYSGPPGPTAGAAGAAGVSLPPAAPGPGDAGVVAPVSGPSENVSPGNNAPASAPSSSTGADAAAAAPPPAAPAAADAGAVLAACSSAAEINAKILQPKCAKCHNAMKPAGGLDLETAGAKARLLNIAAKCAGKTLIVSDPDVSGHFFEKLSGAVPNCGMRMPLMGTPLSADEMKCLKEWIKPPGGPPAAPPAAPATPPPVQVPACATPQEITAKILQPKCGNCHGARMPAAGLDLVSAGSKMRLLNVPSKLCNNKPLISAEAEVGGHFFDKLAGPVPGCGGQMPFGGITPLNQAEIKCLKDWIKPTP